MSRPGRLESLWLPVVDMWIVWWNAWNMTKPDRSIVTSDDAFAIAAIGDDGKVHVRTFDARTLLGPWGKA